jgi:hypothetical protein
MKDNYPLEIVLESLNKIKEEPELTILVLDLLDIVHIDFKDNLLDKRF